MAQSCVVCTENPVGTVFTRCGHMCLCSDCMPGIAACPMCRKEGACIRTFQSGFDEEPAPEEPVPEPARAPAHVKEAIDRIYAAQAGKTRNDKAASTHTRNEERARGELANGYTCGVDAARVGKRGRAFMLKARGHVLQLCALRPITEVTDTHVTLGGTRKTVKVPRENVFVRL